MTTTFTAQQSRVDALVRLLGLVVLVFGAAMLYYTYSNATASGIAPEIITINYALGLLLLLVGVLAAFAKFK
jgi:membrane-bound ClpP family serine protease